MTYTDSFSDRYSFSTDNNEYATGLNDENVWDENIMDYNVPLDERIDDYFDDPYSPDEEYVYNESGYDRERIY